MSKKDKYEVDEARITELQTTEHPIKSIHFELKMSKPLIGGYTFGSAFSERAVILRCQEGGYYLTGKEVFEKKVEYTFRSNSVFSDHKFDYDKLKDGAVNRAELYGYNIEYLIEKEDDYEIFGETEEEKACKVPVTIADYEVLKIVPITNTDTAILGRMIRQPRIEGNQIIYMTIVKTKGGYVQYSYKILYPDQDPEKLLNAAVEDRKAKIERLKYFRELYGVKGE